MADVDAVVAALEQARTKLAEAKSKGLQAVTQLGKARNSVGHTLGRSGANSTLLAQLQAKERACLKQVQNLDVLIKRLDDAIAQTRAAAGGGGVPAPTGGG